MADSKDFNPFRILPESLMLKVLFYTFEKDAKSGFEHFMDYDSVNKKLREILSNEENWSFIVKNTPPEFNVEMISDLKNNKIKTKEGRYQVGICLLLLKFIYARVKPHADDEYLIKQYDYYYSALDHINTHFKEFPGVLYANAYVSFHIAKRLLTMHKSKGDMKAKGGVLYLLAIDCAQLADKLDHPLAKLFHDDINIQLVRQNIQVKKHIEGKILKAPTIKIEDVIEVLSPDKKIDFSSYSEEEQEIIIVTWQKLMIENLFRAQDLFKFAVNYELVKPLTEYFYSCFSQNHFHRMVLAYNPIFVMSDRKENILYLFKQYNINALVTIHQAFRIFYPKPDSVLMSTLLKLTVDEIKAMSGHIDHVLSLPKSGTRGWQINFLDAYRESVDDGSLKEVSPAQMKIVLHYFNLVDRAGELAIIVEREAYMLGKILHCQDDTTHNVAMAVIKQLMRLTSFDPLGSIDQQEILLSCLYNHRDIVYGLNVSNEKDYDQIATTITQAYKNLIAVPVNSTNNVKVIVPEFIKRNTEKLNELKVELDTQFKSLGFRA